MSRFISDRFEKLCAYTPGEQPHDMKYIKLNTNESPYPPSPAVLAAIGSRQIEKLRLYSDPDCIRLKKALANEYNIEPDNVMVGNGSDEVLSFIFMAFCDGKTGVSYPDISYGFYSVFADLYCLKKTVRPLREDFSICADDYCCAGSTVVIANPNAPTGLCLSLENIEKIVKSNSGNIVAIDEAYIDFGGESCVELTKKYDNLLAVQTFSKSRSLAGARLGYAIGNAELIADLEKLRYSTNPYNINGLSQLAGIAAVESRNYYNKNIAEIVLTREYTTQKLRDLGFVLNDSKANFVFARHKGLSGGELYSGLRSRGILVRHFNAPRISDYIRITIGTRGQMDEMINALKEMLNYAKL